MAKKDTAAVPVKGSKLMVIGGASLVGSATVDEMLARGAEQVVIFDNLSFGGQPNIAHLEGNPKVKVVQGDILKLHQLLAATEGLDGIVHLAAFMTLNFDRDPWGGIDVNIRGLQNVLEACRANKVKKRSMATVPA